MQRYIDEFAPATSYSKIVEISSKLDKLGDNPDFFKVLDLYGEFSKHSNYLGLNNSLLKEIETLKQRFKQFIS